MPTYEYACRACGEHLEAVQSFSDEALTTCPTCGGELRKVFGNVGIVFKGNGFYKNDSRAKPSEKKPSEPKAESSTTSSTESAKESPSSSKPAEKKEAASSSAPAASS